MSASLQAKGDPTEDVLGFELLRSSLYKGLEWDLKHTKLPVAKHISTREAVRTLMDCQKNCGAILDAFQIDELEELEKVLRRMVLLTMPTEEDDSKREACLRRLEGSLPYVKCKGIKDCSLRLMAFGSFVSGLYSKNGDLDISIHGHVTVETGKNPGPVPVSMLKRSLQKRLLNSLFRCTIRNPLFGDSCVLLRARVPIIKYLDVRSQVSCDVAVARDDGRFKSVALKVLSQIDWRFSALVRLIKMWASEHKVNDASQGTLNSFSLILLVIFHLQTRSVPVLPPLFLLLSHKGDKVKRPMKYDLDTRNLILEEMVEKSADWRSKRSKSGTNRETLLELVVSFFHIIKGLTYVWGRTDSYHYSMCHVREDTWEAQLKHEAWPKSRAVCSIEDPFDAQENCSRAVQLPSQLKKIESAAEKAIQSLSAYNRGKKSRNENALMVAFGYDVVSSAQKQHALRNNVLLKPGTLVLKREKLPIEITKFKNSNDLLKQIAAVNHSNFKGFEDWSVWNLSKMGNGLVHDSSGNSGGMIQPNKMVSYMTPYIFPPGLVPPPPPGIPNQTAEIHSMILELESIGLCGEKAAQDQKKKSKRRWNRGRRNSAQMDQHLRDSSHNAPAR